MTRVLTFPSDVARVRATEAQQLARRTSGYSWPDAQDEVARRVLAWQEARVAGGVRRARRALWVAVAVVACVLLVLVG